MGADQQDAPVNSGDEGRTAAHPLTLPKPPLRLPILGLQALIALRLAMLAATDLP